jgi:prevent-host-death family protein
MKIMSAGKAKNGFGLLMDTARAEPVTIEKHGRPVAVVLSVEEYERLRGSQPDKCEPVTVPPHKRAQAQKPGKG